MIVIVYWLIIEILFFFKEIGEFFYLHEVSSKGKDGQVNEKGKKHEFELFEEGGWKGGCLFDEEDFFKGKRENEVGAKESREGDEGGF